MVSVLMYIFMQYIRKYTKYTFFWENIGNTWKFYSRSLKPVTQSKIIHVINDIPLSCPNANNIILDSEILMVDKVTGNPLPFGSLGKHKKLEFKNATPCLFVFDILYFNGKSLIDTPLKERRDLLEKNFKPIKNSIHLSELTKIENADALMDLMVKFYFYMFFHSILLMCLNICTQKRFISGKFMEYKYIQQN